MSNLNVTEIKAFVPSKDFEESKNFYEDIGFTMASEGGGIAYFHFNHVSFLLQDYCAGSMAENLTMHFLVQDIDSWWEHIQKSAVAEKYGTEITPIKLQPWAMRDFSITDPSGVTWVIAENV
jgi:uncharacterized glyoxalase superfamily protein PhnB